MNSTEHPMTTEGIESIIAQKYDSLPRNQKKVADFISSNMNEAGFLSVVEIGERCGASKATVVRCAQSLGFEGFLEFKNALHTAVHTKFSNLERFPLMGDSDKETIYEVAQQEVQNINQTMDSLHLETFKTIIEEMNRSETIYTFGQGISALMAQILSYSLNQVAQKSTSLSNPYLSVEEQAVYLTEQDSLVLFSFPPYSKATLRAAELAQKEGAYVISLTDVRSAPIVALSDQVLFIQSENMLFTNSFAAISVAINAITTELSLQNKARTLGHIKRVNSLMTKGNQFESGAPSLT